GEALERLRAGSLPSRSVAITFDDGVWDFYPQAYPVLKKYGFPATIYLTTYYCNYNRPVFNVFCSYLLWKARHKTVEANPSLGLEERVDLSIPEVRDKTWAALLKFANRAGLSGEAKDELARELSHYLGLPYEEFIQKRILHILRPDEVSELASAGIDFELHTHRHRAPQRQDLFEREIEDNRMWIQKMTGKTAAHFCYPSGESHSEFFPWLRQLGVISATTCVPGFATPQSDPLLLPRLVDVMSLSAVEFEGWLAGICSFLPKRSHARQLDD
ncbi:MAG: polysaccharide deacetylase family protein, partial [Terriglobia bacterium]